MNIPDIRVIDTDFKYHGTVDNYESLRFCRKLWEIGAFELHISLKKIDPDLLIPDRLIILDETRVGIIEHIEIVESLKGVEIVARGNELKGITARRLTIPTQRDDTGYFGWDRYPDKDKPDAPAEEIYRYYINTHMISPEDANRIFPRLVLPDNQGRGILTRFQSRFESLSEAFKNLGEFTGMGYNIGVNLSQKQFVFTVIPARNYTVSSEMPVIFATDFGNLDQTVYNRDQKSWITAAYAGGAGEDEGRFIQTVFENDTVTSGFDRREGWIDCGSIEEIDDLIYEAKYKIKDKVKSETLTGNVLDTGPFVYRQDWDLGDKVTVQSRESGVQMDSQITEVEESYEPSRSSLRVTFGQRGRELLDEIRKIEVVR